MEIHANRLLSTMQRAEGPRSPQPIPATYKAGDGDIAALNHILIHHLRMWSVMASLLSGWNHATVLSCLNHVICFLA